MVLYFIIKRFLFIICVNIFHKSGKHEKLRKISLFITYIYHPFFPFCQILRFLSFSFKKTPNSERNRNIAVSISHLFYFFFFSFDQNIKKLNMERTPRSSFQWKILITPKIATNKKNINIFRNYIVSLFYLFMYMYRQKKKKVQLVKYVT